MTVDDLILRHVRLLDDSLVDIAIRDGLVRAIAPRLDAVGEAFDGQGRTILPGLIDHHIHLFATAAKMASVDLSGAETPTDLAARIRKGPETRASKGWVRAIAYDERIAGLLDKHIIDSWDCRRPVRIQDRTGALWMLNSPALAQLGSGPYPDCVECDGQGEPTGRIWRGDAWLREQLGHRPPSLASLSRTLASHGITAVTDAGAQNGPSEAALFATSVCDGDLLQRLTVMGREDLPSSPFFAMGPLKLLYDERDLPDLAVMAARIRTARRQGRAVAAHCVTTAELLVYLAALDLAGGARAGDRIEHGSVIPESLIADIADKRLTVVTQPGFIFERGDRYRAEIDAGDQSDLYRLASLLAHGIAVAAGSDAPYADIDPWIAIQAAQDRRTLAGHLVGQGEAVPRLEALALYSGKGLNARREQPAITPGMPADLCLLAALPAAFEPRSSRSEAAMTLIGGKIVHLA